MPKIVKTVSHSPVSQMLEYIRQNKSKIAPASLPDIIMNYFKPTPTRNHEFKSAMTGAARLLAHGAEYNDLVGKVIFPATRKYGTAPKWAVNVSEMNSIVPIPNWATSNELTVITQKFTSLGITITSAELGIISKMGRKNYEATTGLLEKSAEKANEESLLRRDAESELERKERELEEIRRDQDERMTRVLLVNLDKALIERGLVNS